MTNIQMDCHKELLHNNSRKRLNKQSIDIILEYGHNS